MLVDKSNRKLKPGCFVDLYFNGMITAQIAEIHESVLSLPGQQGTIPPRIVLALMPIQLPVSMLTQEGNGMVP